MDPIDSRFDEYDWILMYKSCFPLLNGRFAAVPRNLPMSATIIARQDNAVTIQVHIPLTRSLLDTEEAIQQALNQAGCLATAEALQQFDTDGSPLVFGPTRWTSKGQEPKAYQTPYGEVSVARHLDQTGEGGATFCPLERDARMILTATPRFAKQLSSKYGAGPAARVVKDLAGNHGRPVSLALVQDTAAAVAAVVQAKEEQWHYATPKLTEPIATISVGLDGTCLLLTEDGHRQAMVASLSLYDREGERQHTIYVAATPQYGKDTFYQRLSREIEHVQQLYPTAHLTGVADGSEDNWTFLRRYTQAECVDFDHATAYLYWVAKAVQPRDLSARAAWLDDRCHRLKHEPGYAVQLLSEIENVVTAGLSETVQEEWQKAWTYFQNHHQQMRYAERVLAQWPIGSGVTEAACKTIVKVRLCRGGAKWKAEGAAAVLSLRTLIYTEGRWEQFWAKIDRYGFPVAIAV